MANILLTKFTFYLLNFLANTFDYIYLSIKVYRILCFLKITFDQMPLFNPYKWPLSFVRIITRPYLAFWARFLPNLKFGNMSYEISTIVALEFLACILRVSFYIRLYIFHQLEIVTQLLK
jgi:uncharacterized protein YggT (Ycf19 family)